MSSASPSCAPIDRRGFMAYFSALGLGGTLLPGILWARAQEADLTVEMVAVVPV